VKKEIPTMTIGTLLMLREIWKKCAGKGNLPVNAGTAENLFRVERALKPVAELQEDPDVKVFLSPPDKDDPDFNAEAREAGEKKWKALLEQRVPFQARKYDMARIPDTLMTSPPAPGEPRLDALFTQMLIMIGQIGG